MSYILDALRKSELQRNQVAAPSRPLELPLASAPASPRPAYRLWLPAAVALMAIASFWLWPEGAKVAPPIPALPGNSVPVPASTGAESAPAPDAAAPSAMPAQEAKTRHAVAPVNQDETIKLAPPAVAAPARAAEATTPTVDRNLVEQAAPAATLADLPPEVRQAIPAMTIAMHSYSDKAAERMVMVNGKILHEGDELTPGLRLDRVTAEGLVFAYRGYRIQRGLH
ncbi:MAG: general secretion pathway protein GspB [Thiobacillus sp.]|nr:general secretion pathway protein GspB [Thiobacillus sp.]